MHLVLSPQQREMLKQLAKIQRRSMNDVIRLAIERVYMAEMLAQSSASGQATGAASASARSR